MYRHKITDPKYFEIFKIVSSENVQYVTPGAKIDIPAIAIPTFEAETSPKTTKISPLYKALTAGSADSCEKNTNASNNASKEETASRNAKPTIAADIIIQAENKSEKAQQSNEGNLKSITPIILNNFLKSPDLQSIIIGNSGKDSEKPESPHFEEVIQPKLVNDFVVRIFFCIITNKPYLLTFIIFLVGEYNGRGAIFKYNRKV